MMHREHPELTELLCVEVMARQLQACPAVHQHAVLAALAPWMKNLSFAARWEGALVAHPCLAVSGGSPHLLSPVH